ncbi:CBS domain-containing protein [Sphingomonas sp. SUN039]|uniref:CBS domain-containing protein n=1 Tax=Sphingomonas sp. SUN039 TaxID=2937787 RepID=UPI0021646E10|nr:CBS domain-containing protein [Sphingomonas sp. SUN039]UVO54886.1 CBS domain-containing protein [Sphingomonas sp. SUN039]
MTVRAIISGKDGGVTSIAPDATVADAVKLLATFRIGAVPVTDATGVIGIFSERDVIYGLERDGAAALDKRVGDVMTSPALTVEPDAPVMSALSMMSRRRIRHLPVVEGGAMVGFVSIGDLVKHRIDKIESEAAALRDYIAS